MPKQNLPPFPLLLASRSLTLFSGNPSLQDHVLQQVNQGKPISLVGYFSETGCGTILTYNVMGNLLESFRKHLLTAVETHLISPPFFPLTASCLQN